CLPSPALLVMSPPLPPPVPTPFPYTTLFRSGPALRRLLPWPAASRFDELVPDRLRVPSSSSYRVDYPDPGSDDAPVLAVKLQERSEEHTSELQSRFDLVCRRLLEEKNDLQRV